MQIHHVSIFDRKILTEVLRIHDEMPLEWDPKHAGSSEWCQQKLQEMENDFSLHGIWILLRDQKIFGELWALQRPQANRASVNSVWIHPSERQKKWLPEIARQVLLWAAQRNCTEVEVRTHTRNQRMQEILSAMGFVPQYIEYLKPITS